MMIRTMNGRRLRHGVMLAALMLGGGWVEAPRAADAKPVAGDSVRKELAPALLAAQAALQEQRWADVLSQLALIDAVPDKSDYEAFVIARVRGVAALSSKDLELADKSFTTVMANARTQDVDAQRLSAAMVTESFRAKEYERSIKWLPTYRRRGGADVQVLNLKADALYLLDRPVEAAAALEEELKAPAPTPEERLQLLASSYLKARDGAAYLHTLERLVAVVAKPAYWADLVQRTEAQDRFASRLLPDGCRLRQAVGALQDADDREYCAQVMMDGGWFVEAQSMLAGSPLPSTKTGQTLAAKLAPLARDEANQAKRGAFKPETAVARVHVGGVYVANGQVEKGVALVKQGLDAGGLKYEQTARLRYGQALVAAHRLDEAKTVFGTVAGTDGERDLARLWLLHLHGGAAR